MLHDKEKNECKIIDVSCPFDGRVIDREEEKKGKYEDLRREVTKLWSAGADPGIKLTAAQHRKH